MSLDGLRELAGFRAENGCAISLYLDLDPSVSPTAGDVATRVRSLLDAGSKSHGATRGDLSHEVRQGLREDLERLERFFGNDFDRDGAQGLAVFAAGLDNVWSVVPLPLKVPDTIRVADDFLLAPLVPLVGRGGGALVAVVNREQGRLYALRNGRLQDLADLTEDAPRRHDQGGWSQANFQRHVDNLAHEHYKRVGEELERQFRRLQRPRIVVVCSDDVRPEFAQALSTEVCDAIVGWTAAEHHAGAAELHAAVVPLLESWRAEREDEAVERWREEVGRNGRATSGWAETLEAASDARVELLLYAEGVQRHAYRCPACGRAAAAFGACPLDGTSMEARDDGLDVAVRLTLANGGEALAVEHRPDLEPVEGIGALLRF
ncbi:MAG TPA: Vms1/Ankzf1 family peptidyl-tRNA hydrolase [Gaiellaceae bacterium]|nr:Vms1/Ankzf1 family peptidyl-tRNA hydrolase [Gaiellaceae bacterium]